MKSEKSQGSCPLCRAGVRLVSLPARRECVLPEAELVLVCAGVVKLLCRDERGNKLCIWIFGEGDLILIPVLGRPSLSLEPLMASKVHLLPVDKLGLIPEFGSKVQKFNRLVYLRTFELGTYSVREQVEAVLLRLASQFGKRSGESWELGFLKKKDLLDILGCSRPMLAAAFASLERKDRVRWEGRQILVREALAGPVELVGLRGGEPSPKAVSKKVYKKT